MRYADDWVVGILGPVDFAKRIKGMIKEYLVGQLKLELSEDKTKITNLVRERANFLGMRFWVRRAKNAKVVSVLRSGKRFKARINQARV